MNIFYLDKNVIDCAAYHCDKHVVKMILEYAQLLSTAHHVLDGSNAPVGIYKKTHVNHPSAIWVRESFVNYNILYNLWTALCEEYTYRFNKTHATETKLRNTLLLNLPPKNIPIVGSTEMPQCMPDYCKIPGNPIEAYRNYYRNEKSHLHKWTNKKIPEWI
jgi:hypothetical protein